MIHTGTAVNKIFLDNNQAVPAFRKLVVDFKAPVQRVVFKAEPLPHKTGAKPVTTEDVKELKLSWSELTDVHDFGRLLKDLGISREQSFELIGTDAAYKIAPRAVHVLFDEAAKSGQPLLVFVSNPGIIQIYGGKVEQATAAGDWYQVQAPDFSDGIAQGRYSARLGSEAPGQGWHDYVGRFIDRKRRPDHQHFLVHIAAQ